MKGYSAESCVRHLRHSNAIFPADADGATRSAVRQLSKNAVRIDRVCASVVFRHKIHETHTLRKTRTQFSQAKNRTIHRSASNSDRDCLRSTCCGHLAVSLLVHFFCHCASKQPPAFVLGFSFAGCTVVCSSHGLSLVLDPPLVVAPRHSSLDSASSDPLLDPLVCGAPICVEPWLVPEVVPRSPGSLPSWPSQRISATPVGAPK